MNLSDKYFLIIFVCGFLDSLLANIGEGNEESKSENSNRKSQNIQKFCQSNFYDTNNLCGIGIIGRTGGARCIKWKYSQWNKNGREQNTTFCHKFINYYFCATSYSKWDYCRPIKCISATSDKTCQSNIHWLSTSSSIGIDYSGMPAENNFLIFAYIGPNGCLVSQLCRNCDSTNHTINIHFETCTLIKERINNTKVINITNLSPDTKYTFYLIPVFNNSHIGHMAKLSLHTKPPEPNIPSNIKIIDRTTTKITIKWDPPQQTNIYGPAKEYLIEITPIIDAKRTYKTSINNYTFDNLQPCQNYCFILASMNDAGYSARSESKCFSTKAETLKITNYTVNESFNQINISLEMDCSNALENSIYRFLLTNKQKKCFYQVIFECEDCPYKFLESHLNGSQLIEYQNIKYCPIIETKIFYKTDSKFFIEISKSHFDKNERDASISIFAINPSGLHQIMKRESIYSQNPKSFSPHLYLLIIGVIVLSIITIAFIAVKKFKSLKLNGESTEIRNYVTIEKEPTNTICLNPIGNATENQSELVHELMKDKASILKEYKDLIKTSEQLERVNELTNIIANLPENIEKNKFKNILPYDQSRVLLKDKSSGSDYINASLISFENDPSQIEYIAAQGPNEANISDFWLMIWEQNISIIVMLTKTYEDGKQKCIQYWPGHLNVTQSLGSDMLVSVSLEEEKISEVFIERKLSIKHNVTSEKRNIIHLQMETWSDISVPKLEDFELFHYRFHQLISSTTLVPYLVHCSEGVGKTGTFIVIDRIIRKLTSGNQNIYIEHEVLKVRKYRKFMVSRQTQYIFIYEFIRYFVEKYVQSSEYGEGSNIYFNVE